MAVAENAPDLISAAWSFPSQPSSGFIDGIIRGTLWWVERKKVSGEGRDIEPQLKYFLTNTGRSRTCSLLIMSRMLLTIHRLK